MSSTDPGSGDRGPVQRARGVGMNEDAFERYRSLLFTVAYQMLGSASDAEDVVQETWLRWSRVDQAVVREPRAYLVRIATRQALNRLRTVSRRREEYVGEWLPEPLLTSPDVADDVELAESLSIAMLTVLETLGPTERAVFVLHEVFATPYDEIASAIGKSPAAVRQIAHRAREHVAARRPRMSVSGTEQRQAVERFLTAARQGDLQSLLDVLSPDVVLVADGGGVVRATLHPIEGAEPVADFIVQRARTHAFEVEVVWINGSPGGRVDLGGRVNTALSLVVENGRVTRIFVIRNPAKLGGLEGVATVTRS